MSRDLQKTHFDLRPFPDAELDDGHFAPWAYPRLVVRFTITHNKGLNVMRKLLTFWTALILSLGAISYGHAFFMNGCFNCGGGGGSGGSATFTTVTGLANAQNLAFGSLTYTSPPITFPAGTIIISVLADSSRISTITSVSIKGVTATQIASASNTEMGTFYANGVTAGSGTVAIVNSVAWGSVGVVGGAVTGSASTTPSGTSDVLTNAAHNTADLCSAGSGVTVPSGGVGVANIISFGWSGSAYPLTWTGAAGQTAMEFALSGSMATGGASKSTSGAFNPTSLSGGGPAWAFQVPVCALVAWGP